MPSKFKKGIISAGVIVFVLVGLTLIATVSILASHEGTGVSRYLSTQYIRCVVDANRNSNAQDRAEDLRDCERDYRQSSSLSTTVSTTALSSPTTTTTTTQSLSPPYPAAPAGYTQIYPGVYLRLYDGSILSLGSVFINLASLSGWNTLDSLVRQAVISSREAIAHGLRDLKASQGRVVRPTGSTTSSVVSAAEAINRTGNGELHQLLPSWLVCWNSKQWWPAGYVYPFRSDTPPVLLPEAPCAPVQSVLDWAAGRTATIPQ